MTLQKVKKLSVLIAVVCLLNSVLFGGALFLGDSQTVGIVSSVVFAFWWIVFGLLFLIGTAGFVICRRIEKSRQEDQNSEI